MGHVDAGGCLVCLVAFLVGRRGFTGLFIVELVIFSLCFVHIEKSYVSGRWSVGRGFKYTLYRHVFHLRVFKGHRSNSYASFILSDSPSYRSKKTCRDRDISVLNKIVGTMSKNQCWLWTGLRRNTISTSKTLPLASHSAKSYSISNYQLSCRAIMHMHCSEYCFFTTITLILKIKPYNARVQ